MSNKKLLSEAQVRRFMGLAGIDPINEMAYHAKKDDMEETMYEAEEEKELPAEEPMDAEKPMDAEEPEEKPMDNEADLEMDEKVLMRIKDNLAALEADLEPLLSQVEGSEDMEAMDDQEDEMPGEEMPEEDPMDDEMPADEDDDLLEAELAEVNMELTEEEIVNEVARRVAKRIVEAKRAHKKMNEALGRKK